MNSIQDGIHHVKGRLALYHQGQRVPHAAYCDYILRGDWEERVRAFADAGVQVFYLRFSRPEDQRFWGIPEADWPATPDRPLDINLQAETILRFQPEARFFIRPNATPPETWLARHADARHDV